MSTFLRTLDSPRLVVQVKSGNIVVDQPTMQVLNGAVHTASADQGLLVSWNGFTKPVEAQRNELFFKIRLWGRSEFISALLDVYELLPEEIRAELPLQRTWTLVPDPDVRSKVRKGGCGYGEKVFEVGEKVREVDEGGGRSLMSLKSMESLKLDAAVGGAMCKIHQAGFEHGWFSVAENYRIIASPKLRQSILYVRSGDPLRLPENPMYAPAREALAWHRNHNRLG